MCGPARGERHLARVRRPDSVLELEGEMPLEHVERLVELGVDVQRGPGEAGPDSPSMSATAPDPRSPRIRTLIGASIAAR